jgi:hypothetical protein
MKSVAIAALALGSFSSGLAMAQGVLGVGPADPPPGYNLPAAEITVSSVVPGQKAGIEVGQCPPDFALQPIQPYPALEKWLGSTAAKSATQTIMLSQLVGKVPVMLLFGSYT